MLGVGLIHIREPQGNGLRGQRRRPLEGISNRTRSLWRNMLLFAELTENMATKLGFIAERAKREKTAIFDNVMHHINEESLKVSYQQLRKECAVGVDGTNWEEYGKELENNIRGLMGRMKQMSYRPQAVRRVYIPKDNGTQRPLGIPAVEDKMVQKAMSRIMEAIYEQDFHEDSYGFRTGKNCHQALKRINDLIMTKPINHVTEVDIKGYFDNVEHNKLIDWLKVRITDGQFLLTFRGLTPNFL